MAEELLSHTAKVNVERREYKSHILSDYSVQVKVLKNIKSTSMQSLGLGLLLE